MIKLTYLLLISLWWVADYYLLNSYCFFFKNTQYFFNNLLTNPLNKYHPILFFTSYIFIYNSANYLNYFTNYRLLGVTFSGYFLNYVVNSVKNGFFLGPTHIFTLPRVVMSLAGRFVGGVMKLGCFRGFWVTNINPTPNNLSFQKSIKLYVYFIIFVLFFFSNHIINI
jgi:hypothetical protein